MQSAEEAATMHYGFYEIILTRRANQGYGVIVGASGLAPPGEVTRHLPLRRDGERRTASAKRNGTKSALLSVR